MTSAAEKTKFGNTTPVGYLIHTARWLNFQTSGGFTYGDREVSGREIMNRNSSYQLSKTINLMRERKALQYSLRALNLAPGLLIEAVCHLNNLVHEKG
jgi:hypothetical protein